ncbi:MAG: DNA gyrase modulator [Myxococcota bacterium]
MATTDRLSRRDFLQVGATTVTLPGFLACAGGQAIPPPTPSAGPMAPGYFEKEFGVTKEGMRQVMAAAMSRGGDFADLFFEHSSNLEVGYEDGKVNLAKTSIGLGVGIRVVVGDQTGYAFTEELTVASMTEAARTAAGIASAKPGSPPVDFTPARHARHYNVDYDWRDVGVTTIKPMLESLAQRAHALEPNLRRVQQRFVAGQKNIMVVDSEGRVSVDRQPMTRIFCDGGDGKGRRYPVQQLQSLRPRGDGLLHPGTPGAIGPRHARPYADPL